MLGLASLFGSGGTSLIVYAVIGLSIISGSFYEGYHIATDHAAAQQLAVEKQVQIRIAAEAAKYNTASTELEQEKAKQHVVVQKVTQMVDRIVARPVYVNVCFDDDGVLAVNRAIAGTSADPGQPDKPMPATGTSK